MIIHYHRHFGVLIHRYLLCKKINQLPNIEHQNLIFELRMMIKCRDIFFPEANLTDIIP